jgi:hypothetical protein
LRCGAGEIVREIPPFLVARRDAAVAEHVGGGRRPTGANGALTLGQRSRGLGAGRRRRGHGHGHIHRALIGASWKGARALGRRRRRGHVLRIPFAAKEPALGSACRRRRRRRRLGPGPPEGCGSPGRALAMEARHLDAFRDEDDGCLAATVQPYLLPD